MKNKIDLDRLQKEFEKAHPFKRKSGKTLHLLVRALAETDFGNNVIILHNHTYYYSQWLVDYLMYVAKELGYTLNILQQILVEVDNRKTIKILKERDNILRGINLQNTVVLKEVI